MKEMVCSACRGHHEPGAKCHDGVRVGWCLPGSEITWGSISAREAKPIGAKIVIDGPGGRFIVYHHDNWGDERSPWRLTRRTPEDDDTEVMDEFSQMRDAVQVARRYAAESPSP